MIANKLFGSSLLLCFTLSLTACMTSSGTAGAPTPATVTPQQEVVYVAHPQSIGTYTVDPSTGNLTQVAADVDVGFGSPQAGPLEFTVSSDGHFLYLQTSDATGAEQLVVLSTDARGVPQMPSVQTVDLPAFSQVTFDPNGKWAYVLTPTFDESTQAGSAVIDQWSVDPGTGKLSDTGVHVSDPPVPFSNYALNGTVQRGSAVVSSAFQSVDGFSQLAFLSHAVDPQTGAPSTGTTFVGRGWEWGDDDVTAINDKYVVNFFNGLEDRFPGMTYIDVFSTQVPSSALIHCTSTMTDACLNAGNQLQFDAAGDFLVVDDVVNQRIRLLAIDAANKVLRDTGSSLPADNGLQLIFSPDDAFAFGLSGPGGPPAQIQVYAFDKSTGSLTAKGSPLITDVPFTVVPGGQR